MSDYDLERKIIKDAGLPTMASTAWVLAYLIEKTAEVDIQENFRRTEDQMQEAVSERIRQASRAVEAEL